MNSKDFNELVEARCSKIKATLASKGKEYSTDDDKLHNFNKAGIRSGQSREKALMGMKLKHEISIDDIILNLDIHKYPTIEIIDEKIGDIINYFILLEACLVDRIRKENRQRPLTPEECFKIPNYIHNEDKLVDSIYQSKIEVEHIKSKVGENSSLRDRMNEPPDWGNLVGIKKEKTEQLYVGDTIRRKNDKTNTALFLNFIEENMVQYYVKDYKAGEYPIFTTISHEELQNEYELWTKENSSNLLEGQVLDGSIYNSNKDIALDVNRNKLDRYIILYTTYDIVYYFTRVGNITKTFNLPLQQFKERFTLWKEDS